ncbi:MULTISPECIES: ABC transporter substrate-binding protein [Actinomadura]|uniref:ABC transporter substrate-binding protein n=1 Tax=Actinomadura geliboluensis TaxID=882440 RepID=A0A5S4GT47_9ACTN|nr:ABC transporter substrate-binding protein [Actinomadura geliboluensis]TMR35711.1 ABC transporter substrate-binding protein [Actinomadura geliboluensis]
MTGASPRRGGVLRLYGPGSMDHVDPASSYYMLSGQILRLFTRQLFAYPPIPVLRDWRQVVPVPDLATEMPTLANGLLSDDHLTYTVPLRRGVLWDTEPAREVTAHDVVRGFKRAANPVFRGGAIHYYTSTIRGFARFSDDYTAAMAGTEPTARDLAAFQNSHDIPGVRAVDDHTVRFELVRPALDFPHILAMTFGSPAPAEYDGYLPDGPDFRANVRSIGPYRLSHYVHGRELRMERNPVWRQETDPIRHQYLDGVEVVMEKATPDQVGERIRSGGADLSWASPVTEPYDVNPTDPGNNLGYALNPYLVFNMVSPNEDGATTKLKVRQAISYAVDRTAMVTIFDELSAGTVMWPATSAIPPGNYGYRELDPYPTPGFRGDPEKARALLVEAGYADGLTLTMVHRDVDANPEVAESLAADLAKIGITLRMIPLGHADYYPFLQDPANARAGGWDLSAPAWTPDWFGNNGRAFLQPMFQTNETRGTSNYGCYSDPETDRLIEAALSATDQGEAEELWHRVDARVMADAAIVPLLVHAPTIPHLRGARVRDAVPMPTIDRWFDLANLWLEP